MRIEQQTPHYYSDAACIRNTRTFRALVIDRFDMCKTPRHIFPIADEAAPFIATPAVPRAISVYEIES